MYHRFHFYLILLFSFNISSFWNNNNNNFFHPSFFIVKFYQQTIIFLLYFSSQQVRQPIGWFLMKRWVREREKKRKRKGKVRKFCSRVKELNCPLWSIIIIFNKFCLLYDALQIFIIRKQKKRNNIEIYWKSFIEIILNKIC